MEDDAPPAERRYPLSKTKMSKTPSWVMLGFLLGAAFVAALPPLRKGRAVEPVEIRRVESAKPLAPREPGPLSTIEAVFDEWGKHAVWSDDYTEVALWNLQDRAFTDFYAVRRLGDTLYFRTIPAFTRRIIERGKPMPDSPLQFTESEAQYNEWRQYGRTERPADRDLKPVMTRTRSTPAVPILEGPETRTAPPTLEKIMPSLELTPKKEEDKR